MNTLAQFYAHVSMQAEKCQLNADEVLHGPQLNAYVHPFHTCRFGPVTLPIYRSAGRKSAACAMRDRRVTIEQ